MLETVVDPLQSFVGAMRFADVLDIALITCVIYWLLMSVRRQASTAGVTILLLVLAYFFARWWGMFLTQWIFQVGLTVIALAVLVLFQEDARRQLERLLDWRSWGRPASTSTSRIADPLIEALGQMAHDHTGAIVVLTGQDSPERHIHGGVQLDGLVSFPILLSIFDASSPGHDGAVVIEKDRIKRFAEHLPLSRQVYQGQQGTRHAAALGLSELCDALVFVVSEERGVVSVAREGNLTTLESTAEITHELSRFLTEHGSSKPSRPGSRILTVHLGTKVASLTLSLALWGMFVWDVEPVQRTFEVPVEFRNVPPQWGVLEVEPSEVRVTLAGPENQFELLDAAQLRFSPSMDESIAGLHSIWLADEDLESPPGLEVRAITPQRIWFQVAPRAPPPSAPVRSSSAAP